MESCFSSGSVLPSSVHGLATLLSYAELTFFHLSVVYHAQFHSCLLLQVEEHTKVDFVHTFHCILRLSISQFLTSLYSHNLLHTNMPSKQDKTCFCQKCGSGGRLVSGSTYYRHQQAAVHTAHLTSILILQALNNMLTPSPTTHTSEGALRRGKRPASPARGPLSSASQLAAIIPGGTDSDAPQTKRARLENLQENMVC